MAHCSAVVYFLRRDLNHCTIAFPISQIAAAASEAKTPKQKLSISLLTSVDSVVFCHRSDSITIQLLLEMNKLF